MFDENKNAVNVFNEMAEVYQQKYMNVDRYQESLEYFLNNLNSADSITSCLWSGECPSLFIYQE